MVYGRILYNNIKEYTPSWFKTIPYSQATKPAIGYQPRAYGNFTADPKVKGLFRLFKDYVQKNTTNYQLYLFANVFVIYHVCFVPLLTLYRANNQHRTLDYAIAQEKAYKKANPSGEEEEE
mmetsp:Transcript_63682/g.88514  ORF Transcript_63682/g.88514 Transcript_63682/m.88514 type:complete len:121 (-) Transcript_63682:194-556(-)